MWLSKDGLFWWKNITCWCYFWFQLSFLFLFSKTKKIEKRIAKFSYVLIVNSWYCNVAQHGPKRIKIGITQHKNWPKLQWVIWFHYKTPLLNNRVGEMMIEIHSSIFIGLLPFNQYVPVCFPLPMSKYNAEKVVGLLKICEL